MSFLVLILVALILRFTPWRSGFPLDVLARWVDWVVARAANWPAWQWLALLLLPLVGVGLLLWGLHGLAYGFFSLLAHTLLLLLCIGRGDPFGGLTAGIEEAWRRQDLQAASLLAERDLGLASDTPEALLQGVRGRMAWEACHGYFVPAFWYLLLGPLGALAYRLLRLAQARAELKGTSLAAAVTHALEWLPARLLGLSFALVGHFDGTLGVLRSTLARWDTAADQLVAQCAQAALMEDQRLDGDPGVLTGTRTLLQRALLVWAVIIALYTVLG